MPFEDQIHNSEIIIDRTPRVYLQWENTEAGRDKVECYERVTINNTILYINRFNRSSTIINGQPFFDVLEKIYEQTLNKK